MAESTLRGALGAMEILQHLCQIQVKTKKSHTI